MPNWYNGIEGLVSRLESALASQVGTKGSTNTGKGWSAWLMKHPDVNNAEVKAIGLDKLLDHNANTPLKAEDLHQWAVDNRLPLEQDVLSNGSTQYGAYTLKGPKQGYTETLYYSPVDDGVRVPREFRANHFEDLEDNLDFHTRQAQRPVSKGGLAHHVEEIQSDWAQAARDKGTYDPARPWEVFDPVTGEIHSSHPTRKSAADAADYVTHQLRREDGSPRFLDYIDARSEDRVPETPWALEQRGVPMYARAGFSKNLYDAASDPNVTHFTWSTGNQNSDHYNLATHGVHELRYTPPVYPNDGELKAMRPDGGLYRRFTVDAEHPLESYIGKELANRLLETDATGTWGVHVLPTHSISVGGQGMRNFYDQKLPKEAAWQLRRLGMDPSVVGTVDVVGPPKVNGAEFNEISSRFWNRRNSPLYQDMTPEAFSGWQSDLIDLGHKYDPEATHGLVYAADAVIGDAYDAFRANPSHQTRTNLRDAVRQAKDAFINAIGAARDTVHGFELTPEIRQRILERGLPIMGGGGLGLMSALGNSSKAEAAGLPSITRRTSSLIEAPLEDVIAFAKQHAGRDLTPEELRNIEAYWQQGSRVPAFRAAGPDEKRAWAVNSWDQPGTHFDLTPDGAQARDFEVYPTEVRPYLLRARSVAPVTDQEANSPSDLLHVLETGSTPYLEGRQAQTYFGRRIDPEEIAPALKRLGVDGLLYDNATEGLAELTAKAKALQHTWKGTGLESRRAEDISNPSLVIMPDAGSRDISRAKFDPERYTNPSFLASAAGGGLGVGLLSSQAFAAPSASQQIKEIAEGQAAPWEGLENTGSVHLPAGKDDPFLALLHGAAGLTRPGWVADIGTSALNQPMEAALNVGMLAGRVSPWVGVPLMLSGAAHTDDAYAPAIPLDGRKVHVPQAEARPAIGRTAPESADYDALLSAYKQQNPTLGDFWESHVSGPMNKWYTDNVLDNQALVNLWANRP